MRLGFRAVGSQGMLTRKEVVIARAIFEYCMDQAGLMIVRIEGERNLWKLSVHQ